MIVTKENSADTYNARMRDLSESSQIGKFIESLNIVIAHQ